MENKIKLTLELVFVFLILSGCASAGLVSPYWKDRPLEMNYGETKTVNFVLQNVDDKDVTYQVNLKQGTDIATLEQTTYTAKAKTEDTLVPLTIKIPKDYDKEIALIELEFKEATLNQGGMVTLGVGYTTSFNVIISEKPVGRSSLLGVIIILAIAILLALAIILVLLKKKKR